MKISKNIYDNLVAQFNRTRKTKLIQAKKRKIVIPQDFEETESEKSDEQNEEEEQTEEESEVDKVIPRKKKRKKNTIKKDQTKEQLKNKWKLLIILINKQS